MPRGKKQCPSCEVFVGSRLSACDCGYLFPESKQKKNPKPFFKERKEFIKRMLCGERSDCMKIDMMTATKIFQDFDNDLDFLSKVGPPFKFNKSIKYLLTKDGKKYLLQKKKEFDFIPEKAEKIIDHNKKTGRDSITKKQKTLTEFLNDE